MRPLCRLEGARSVLVPYHRDHVDRYNSWMQDPEILDLTRSEPLTLEEEYEMQLEWENDPQKVTFIVLDRDCDNLPVGDVNLFLPEGHSYSHLPDRVPAGTAQTGSVGNGSSVVVSETSATSGHPNGGTDNEEEDQEKHPDDHFFEIDVMIADRNARRKGLATEAVAMAMWFGVERLGAPGFMSKIVDSNQPSISLFTKRLGYHFLRAVPVFHEVHYIWRTPQPFPSTFNVTPPSSPFNSPSLATPSSEPLALGPGSVYHVDLAKMIPTLMSDSRKTGKEGQEQATCARWHCHCFPMDGGK